MALSTGNGKPFLIGMQDNGRLSVFERTFNRCMGLWGDGQTLYPLATGRRPRLATALSGWQ